MNAEYPEALARHSVALIFEAMMLPGVGATVRGPMTDSRAERELVSKPTRDIHGVEGVNQHMTVKP
jgi:hypothetical protein